MFTYLLRLDPGCTSCDCWHRLTRGRGENGRSVFMVETRKDFLPGRERLVDSFSGMKLRLQTQTDHRSPVTESR